MPSAETFHILVTDRNHHVCSLLRRELKKVGYTVYSVSSAAMADKYLRTYAPIDLLILDPQLFHSNDQTLISEIRRHHAAMQIILHTYKDILLGLKSTGGIQQIEKNAESISALKNAVDSCFRLFSEK